MSYLRRIYRTVRCWGHGLRALATRRVGLIGPDGERHVETWNRRSIWAAYRPRPSLWSVFHMRWLYRPLPCGCPVNRLTGKQALFCLKEPRYSGYLADLEDDNA